MVASLTQYFKPGDRVFVAGLSGESALLRTELEQFPFRAAEVEFTSIQLPGIDRNDYLSFHPASRLRSYFMTASTRMGLAQQRAAIHPLDYSGIARHLSQSTPFDSVVGQFTPPDADGWCLPGLTADFTPLVWKNARKRVGHLNPSLPRIGSRFRVHMTEFDQTVESDADLLTFPASKPSSVGYQVARHAVGLIRDGDTLQFGIGSVLPDVAAALQSHRRLRIHSGMIAPFIQVLWESGALDRDAPLVTGVIFGDKDFYDYAGQLEAIVLDDVRHTHDIRAIGDIDRFVAVNSAVEVDLFGQVNSERTDGTLHAGAGGLPAFAAGSQMSANGRLLICMSSTAARGQVSRIVPSLGAGSLCTLPRYCADAVVTEFGAAELRGLSMDERAEALTAIAHPDHQAELVARWTDIRARL
jgi:acyl-CoA hydrolase